MKKSSILLAAAASLLAAPAMAQSLPTLTTNDSSASLNVTTTVAPACELVSNMTNPNIAVGPNAITPNYLQGTSLGSVTVTCNTPNSAVQVGSNNLSNPAQINEADASVFTNSIAFVAKVVGSNYTFGLDSRAGAQGPNTWPISAALGAGGTNRRILKANVEIVGLSSGARLPVAGTYTGQVCVTVDPDAALSTGFGPDNDSTCQ